MSEKDFFDETIENGKIAKIPSDKELRLIVWDFMLKKQRNEATETLVKVLEQQNFFYATRHDKLPELWIYEKGIYIPEGKTFIKEFCREILGNAYTEHLANIAASKIEADNYIDAKEFFSNNIMLKIVVENGVLNLKTNELEPFNPKEIQFTKVPVLFDKDATCPKIDQFFKDVLETEEDIKTMFELFGYCLWKENFQEQAVMALGDGRNGKTKTFDLLKRFLGQKNTKSIELQDLEKQSFSQCELFGKLANIAGDLSNETLHHTGKFKSLVGRDQVSANRKFKTTMEFVNYAKLIFATNKLPKTDDTSIAFWERWIYFRFPYTFKTQEELDNLRNAETPKAMKKYKLRDLNILERIATKEEMSGLLNKALEGLKRLQNQKHFTTSKTAEEIMQFWIRESDSFLAFCMDSIEQDPELHIEKERLRKAYQRYCKEHKAIPEDNTRIKLLLETKYGAVEGRISIDGGYMQVYVWKGISLRETK